MLIKGPGWFDDIFRVRVLFNTNKCSIPTRPGEHASCEVSPLWRCSAAVCTCSEVCAYRPAC